MKPADRHLDAALVAEVVRSQFPEVDASRIERVGEGWDNEVYGAGEWIFRFPRHAGTLAALRREIQLMPLVEDALGPLVPRFEKFGEPSDLFPYPFVGYRRLGGIPAEDAGTVDLERLAAGLGEALTRLHSIDVARIPRTPAGWEDETWEDWRPFDDEDVDDVLEVVPASLHAAVEPFLRGEVPPPAFPGPRRFIHNDMSGEHVLVDPNARGLTGLIDFADAMVGDPVGDFVGLITIGDHAFVERTLAHYRLPTDATFRERLAWATRVLSLHWLTEALEAEDPPDDHLAWVSRAFEPRP